MRKILLMICGALTVSGISAQITLTSEKNAPRIGDAYYYHIIEDIEDLNVSYGGANQVWDMSAAGEGFLFKYEYISVAASSQPSSTSNIVRFTEMDGMIGEVFYTTSSTGFAFNEIFAPLTTVSYTDAREFLKFPLTYNQVYNETFAGTITNRGAEQTFDIKGTIKTTADGYGTLKLPFGTIDDVLRVKIVEDYTYSINFYGMDIITTFSDTIYLWYNANTRDFIANYSVLYTDIGWGMEKYQSPLLYMSQDDIIMGMKPTYDHSLSIYPNPTQGIINIAGTNETPNVKIHNVNGTLLQQEKSSIIDISEFSNGLYLIEIAGQKYKIIKK